MPEKDANGMLNLTASRWREELQVNASLPPELLPVLIGLVSAVQNQCLMPVATPRLQTLVETHLPMGIHLEDENGGLRIMITIVTDGMNRPCFHAVPAPV